jgi:DNA-binding MarR family transcriptional regulator
MTYMALREETGLADGNLHVQTRKLISAGYLMCERVPRGKRFVTRFELTERGRMMFLKYVRQLSEAAQGPFAVAGRVSGTEGRPGPDPSRVW